MVRSVEHQRPHAGPFGPIGAALCALGLASVLYGLSLSAGEAGIRWPVVALELVTAVACLFGLLAGFGKIREGVGITIGFAAVAMFVGTGLTLVTLEVPPRGIVTHPWFLARTALAGLIMLAAAGSVLHRRPENWVLVIKGAVLTGLGLGLVAGVVLLGDWITSGSVTMQVVKVVAALVAVTVAAGFLCIGVHLVIRAFERCAPQDAAQPA